jgi:hypothetical protein
MQTWVVAGRTVTNRAGAGEYLGLASNTAAVYFSPSGRAAQGTPAALPVQVDGQDVYAVDDLAAYRAGRRRRRAVPGQARGDPEELIGAGEFAALLGVKPGTFKRYVELSVQDWEGGQDGMLPVPDETSPARHGNTYRWRRRRAAAAAARPALPSTGRPPASVRRPQLADLRAVLADAPPGREPTALQIATEMSARLGVRVTPQAVRRLRQRARAEQKT